MNPPTESSSFLDRLAVCSWSLQPASPEQLAEQMAAIGLSHVQLDLDPFREQPESWSRTAELFKEKGIQIVSGMFRTIGEDYSTLESIRLTGGLVPDATWDENLKNARFTVETAQRLGVNHVMFHAGFLPHEPDNPDFAKLVERVRQIARLFTEAGITLACETGQETGPSLKSFLEHVAEPNVAVNFDPANMILYNNGDPIQALRLVSAYVKSCHIKDACKTQVPGTWGEEVVVGAGEVDWPAFFTALSEFNFGGWLCIEREAGDQRVVDIRTAREHVETVLKGG